MKFSLSICMLALSAAIFVGASTNKNIQQQITGRWQSHSIRMVMLKAGTDASPTVHQVKPDQWKTVMKSGPPEAEYFDDQTFVSRYIDTAGVVTKEVKGKYTLEGRTMTLHCEDRAYDGLTYNIDFVDAKELHYSTLLDLDQEGIRNDSIIGVSKRLP